MKLLTACAEVGIRMCPVSAPRTALRLLYVSRMERVLNPLANNHGNLCRLEGKAFSMKNQKTLPLVLSIVFALACFSISALAQSSDDKNHFASLNSSGSSVKWDIRASHSASTLTVIGPDGEVFTKEFKSGQIPEFQLAGEKLIDGAYTYELRLTPIFAAGVQEKLKAARQKGNGDQPKRAAFGGKVHLRKNNPVQKKEKIVRHQYRETNAAPKEQPHPAFAISAKQQN